VYFRTFEVGADSRRPARVARSEGREREINYEISMEEKKKRKKVEYGRIHAPSYLRQQNAMLLAVDTGTDKQ
jgi:hypothetical protein